MGQEKRPVVVIVRDGWGHNPHAEHDAFNAVKLAKTPYCDQLLAKYPWTLIHTSGEDVGLPDLTMGNSEVGHQNIGAGRIVNQESVRITKSIRDGEFFENPVLVEAVSRAKEAGRFVHLMGLASDVGVHSRLGHLFGCLELCAKLGHDKVTIHCFTDGRDSGPFTGKGFIERIEAKCAEIGIGRIASICGRYYAMDRDNRWERVKLAYDMLTGRSQLPQFATATEAMQDYYDNPSNNSQRGDEFVMPRVVGDACAIGQGDSVIFYNYRGDRPREITRAFVMDNFYGHVPPSPDSGEKGFDRGEKLDLYYVTMTAYEQQLNELVNVAFEKPAKMPNIGGEYISNLALTQFRCAETEKFPHVTFFFNDYRDEPFAGESRQMAQSPKVATYDLQPQMSAPEIGEIILKRLAAEDCEDFILVNFANGDMVGHTGVLAAAITAVETVDTWVGRIAEVALARGGALIVTADHGNAEQMFDPTTNAPHTAHTTFDVQCIVVDADNQNAKLREGGRLADIMPTALDLMGLDVPGEMTGRSLLRVNNA